MTTRTQTEHRWWKPSFSKVERSSVEAEEAVRQALGRAVERRVGGDVPIALSVSSGLDSTIIADPCARAPMTW